jgi:hypothetical protein
MVRVHTVRRVPSPSRIAGEGFGGLRLLSSNIRRHSFSKRQLAAIALMLDEEEKNAALGDKKKRMSVNKCFRSRKSGGEYWTVYNPSHVCLQTIFQTLSLQFLLDISCSCSHLCTNSVNFHQSLEKSRQHTLQAKAQGVLEKMEECSHYRNPSGAYRSERFPSLQPFLLSS